MRFLPAKLVGVLTFALMITSMAAAAELTLDDCIELALKNRASIIAARGAENMASADQRWALGQFLPNISASYNYSKSKQSDIDPPYTGGIVEQDRGPDKDWSISAQMFSFGVHDWFNLIGAKASKAKARLDVIDSEQSLIYGVKVSYYAYLAAVENVEVQKEATKRSEEQLKLIQSKFDLGAASLSDVLKQKVQFGNDRLTRLTAENAVISTKASLAYTIGVDPNSDVGFATSYGVREYDGTLAEAVNFSRTNEPGLLAAEKDLQARNSAVKSRWASYLPNVSGSASYTKYTGTQGFPVSFEQNYNVKSLRFSLNFNIFDGFSRERDLSYAKVNRNNARARLTETKNLVTRDVKTAYLEIQQYKEAKSVAGENVQAAEEDLKITREKYNLGAATILDLLDAQVSLKQAQVSMIRAEFDLNLSVAKLENAMGKM